MSYSALDLSDNQGNPYYLYRFTRQTVDTDFTNLEFDHTHATLGGPFLARAISHGDIYNGKNIRKADLPVTLPESDAFAQSYLQVRTPGVTAVKIWRGHLDDPDDEVRIIFQGIVTRVRSDGEGETELNCISSVHFLKAKGLRPRIQRTCRHVLYNGLCRLNLANWLSAGTATAYVDNTYTITGADSQPDGYWLGGLLEYNGEYAFIVAHAGTSITVRIPIDSLDAQIDATSSVAVQLAPGCDRSAATCENKFNNLLNFGGFPDMPTDDPFSGKSIK